MKTLPTSAGIKTTSIHNMLVAQSALMLAAIWLHTSGQAALIGALCHAQREIHPACRQVDLMDKIC